MRHGVWVNGSDRLHHPRHDRESVAGRDRRRSVSLKHVQRARIGRLSAERPSVQELARRAGVSRAAVWRWQERYGEEGSDRLLRDKTRPPGRPPHPTSTVAAVLALTCSEPLDEVTHWTGRAVAERVGISLRSVQRILGRRPPAATSDADPQALERSHFAENVLDVLGLYMAPPALAVVLSIDEKSQIQAL